MRYAAVTAVLLLSGLLLAAPPKVIEEFSGKVIGVTDGDTIKVLVDKDIASTVSLCSECKASSNWLGLSSPILKVRQSGLWQVNELYKTPLNEADLDAIERCLTSDRTC